MSDSRSVGAVDWDDEDTPEWTDDQLDRAEFAIGGKVVRPAQGTLTRAGRPPLGAEAKRQVTLRIDPDVIEKFREGGAGVAGADERGVAEGGGVVGEFGVVSRSPVADPS